MLTGKQKNLLYGLELFNNKITKNNLDYVIDKFNIGAEYFSKNQIIHYQDDFCNAIDIIVSGEILIQNMDAYGNVLTIKTFFKEDIIGANLIFSKNNKYPMIAIAASACSIIKIDKDIIINLCRMDEYFMLKFMEFLSERTTVLTDKITEISIKGIREKIISFLNHESIIQKSKTIKLPYTKKQLAENMGIQRTSLSRELKKMKNEGLIDYNSKEIHVLAKPAGSPQGLSLRVFLFQIPTN